MLNKTLLIFFFAGLFAGQSLFKLGNQAYFDFDFFDKKISREQVKNEIIKNTNRYAKKQLTWFRKNFKDKFVDEIKIQSIINDLF